jgi:protein arginine N-methyltransferase 1
MYNLSDYGAMIADATRLEAYALALRAAVFPGATVLDLGAGTGILSLLACQCGARKVYAVEPSDALQLARETARANGFTDRVEFVQGDARDLVLPVPADVLVSDLRGVLPHWGNNLPVIIDARQRLLAPGGQLIPRRDQVWVAAVEEPERYRRHVGVWDTSPHGLDLRPAKTYAANTLFRVRATPGQLCTDPVVWAAVDYATVTGPEAEGRARLSVNRAATAHGLLLWFSTDLLDGAGFSNAPGGADLIYGQLFFPWPKPLDLRAGEELEVFLSAHLVQGNYVWCWETTAPRACAGGSTPPRFRQSTFQGTVFSAERLRKLSSAHVPALSDEGRAAHFALGRMSGERPLGELAADLRAAFPEQFPSLPEALTFLGDLAQCYDANGKASRGPVQPVIHPAPEGEDDHLIPHGAGQLARGRTDKGVRSEGCLHRRPRCRRSGLGGHRIAAATVRIAILPDHLGQVLDIAVHHQLGPFVRLLGWCGRRAGPRIARRTHGSYSSAA